MFGKLMSISDELMWRYFDLLSFRSNAELAELRKAVGAGRNPMTAKFELAQGNHRALPRPRRGRAGRGELPKPQPEA